MAEKTYDIKKLQINLNAIRKIAGWTAQELGNKIGVTKQTISNLENQKTEMTLTQYIAIRAVLDYEIESNKSNEILPQVVHVLLDVPDNEINTEERKRIDHAITTLAAASAGGLGMVSLASLGAGLLGGITGLTVIGAAFGASSWKKRIMGKNNNDN